MSSLLNANSEKTFAEQAGLVGYSDKELAIAIDASRKAIAAGRVSPVKEAYEKFKAKRNSPYANLQGAISRAH